MALTGIIGIKSTTQARGNTGAVAGNVIETATVNRGNGGTLASSGITSANVVRGDNGLLVGIVGLKTILTIAADVGAGLVRVYNGVAFELKQAKRWTGSAWQNVALKYFNGISWQSSA